MWSMRVLGRSDVSHNSNKWRVRRRSKSVAVVATTMSLFLFTLLIFDSVIVAKDHRLRLNLEVNLVWSDFLNLVLLLVDDLAVIVCERAHDQKTETTELHPAINGPRLAKATSGHKVEQEEVDDPHTQGSERLNNYAVNCAESVRNTHATDVIEQHHQHVCKHDCGHLPSVEEDISTVQRILEMSVVASGQKVGDGHHPQKHVQTSKEALPSDNSHRGHLQIPQEEFLTNNLAGLHDLAQNNDHHTEELLLLALRVFFCVHVCHSNEHNARHADCNTGPIELVQLTLEKNDRQECREDELCTSKHLVHRYRSIQ
mmetsp:Transcript_12563/g.38401  ORF Transcript_12563/g.38401 Transcript_12563/m.38401 type:complete len:314 (-) Transcript_12563:436-1377(-)